MNSIERIKCGSGNCYIIHQNKSAILVDTSVKKYREHILEKCRHANVSMIVLTHGHLDHVQNAAFLAKSLHIPVAMHEADYPLIQNKDDQKLISNNIIGNLLLFFVGKSIEKESIEFFKPDVYVKDGDSLAKYGVDAEIVGLPGHTKGSIGILSGQDIIVGDALMNMVSPSKPYIFTNREQTDKSVEKINALSPKRVFFGHGSVQIK